LVQKAEKLALKCAVKIQRK